MNPSSSGFLTEPAFDAIFSDYVVFKDISLSNPHGYPETLQSKMDRLFQTHLKLSKMYGSPGELIQNLRIYSDFPSNHQLFNFDVTESYNTRVIKYQSLSGDSFIYKQDMFSLMQRMMTKQLEDETLQSILIIFLKYYEGFLAESCEFIQYDAEWINKLEKDLVELWQKAMTLMLPPPAQPPDYRQMYRRFKEMSPEWAEQDFIPIDWIYEKAYAGLLPNLPSSSIRFLRYLGIGFRKFFISKREYLTPYSVMKSSPTVVRIFVDGADQFVMKLELFDAINTLNPDEDPLIPDDERGILSIISTSSDGEFNRYTPLIKNVHFIRCPIKRAKHAAVPILVPYGGYCILAIDAFFELFHFLVFQHRFFQKINRHNGRIVLGFIERVFSGEKQGPYFITHRAFKDTKSRIEEMMRVFQKEVIDFRSVDEDGFTLDDLNDELNHSGLTDVFPEIQKYAEKVFGEVDEKKKGMVLRTCDLFDALEKCQMLCVIERSHGIKKFIHNQNSCHLFRQLSCNKCKDSAPVSDEDSDKEEHLKDLEDKIVKVLKGLGISKEAENVRKTQEESDSENVSVMMEGKTEDVPEDSRSLEYLQNQGVMDNQSSEVEKYEDKGFQGVQKVLEGLEEAKDPNDVRDSAESTNLEVLEETRSLENPLESKILNIPAPNGQIPEDKDLQKLSEGSKDAQDPNNPQDPEETLKSPEEPKNSRNLEVLDDSGDLENLLESENTKKSVPEVQDPGFGGFKVKYMDNRELEAFQRILSEFKDPKDPEKSEDLQKTIGISSNENDTGNSENNLAKPLDDLPERNFEDSELFEDSKDPEDIQNIERASDPPLEAPESKNSESKATEGLQNRIPSISPVQKTKNEQMTRGIQTEDIGDPEEIRKLKEKILKMEEEHREEIERLKKSYETTVTHLERKIQDLKAMESEDLEKTIRCLKDTNLRLLGQNEEKERMIQMLLNRISNNTPQGF